MKRRLLLLAALTALLSCSTDSGEKSPVTPTPTPTTVTGTMHTCLGQKYLWNDEYKTLDVDLSVAYDKFLDNTLMRMTTNTLDKKPDGNGGYRLFSYITRVAASSRAVGNGVEKSRVDSYGFINFRIVQVKGSSSLVLAVAGVYPDSPAAKAGITRGMMFSQVGGVAITSDNYLGLYYKLMGPSAGGTVSLTTYATNPETYRLATAAIHENPVTYSDVIGKTGYLVYSAFDAAYDEEVLDAFARFKQEGVTDLVLDLRLNGGGHVMSANMISTCVAGTLSADKVFQYYRFNDTRMADPQATAKETTYDYDATAKRFYELFHYTEPYYGTDLSAYALDLPRLYVIVSGATASSSEAVINGLRGAGLSVTMIGQKTVGKNVGMEGISFTIGGYRYSFVPITFQGYNALLETVDPAGMQPTCTVDDWTSAGLVDFGESSEPCLAKALELITGVRSTAAGPMAAGPFTPVAQPEPPHRPGGMLLLPRGE